MQTELEVATAELGFETYGLATWLPLLANKPTVHLLTSGADCCKAVMLERDIGQARAVLNWCKSRHEPIVWIADALPTPATQAAPNVQVGDECRHCWSIGVRDGLGVHGALTLSRSQAIGENESLLKRFHFQMVATKAHQRWLASIRTRAVANLPESLSAREIEVLRWLADGKIAEDVATLLGIKLTTVRFHAKNAARKLGAENTTSAVYRALVLGLLHKPIG